MVLAVSRYRRAVIWVADAQERSFISYLGIMWVNLIFPFDAFRLFDFLNNRQLQVYSCWKNSNIFSLLLLDIPAVWDGEKMQKPEKTKNKLKLNNVRLFIASSWYHNIHHPYHAIFKLWNIAMLSFFPFTESPAVKYRTVAGVQNSIIGKISFHHISLRCFQRILGLDDTREHILRRLRRSLQCCIRSDRSTHNGERCRRRSFVHTRWVCRDPNPINALFRFAKTFEQY